MCFKQCAFYKSAYDFRLQDQMIFFNFHSILFFLNKYFFSGRYRNIALTTLLDQVWLNEQRLTKEMKPILRELTNLVRGETSTVSLKARTILIASEKPSYEIRHNHIEKMFLDAINKSDDTSQVKHFSFLSHFVFQPYFKPGVDKSLLSRGPHWKWALSAGPFSEILST
jgi:hypothetical protein